MRVGFLGSEAERRRRKRWASRQLAILAIAMAVCGVVVTVAILAAWLAITARGPGRGPAPAAATPAAVPCPDDEGERWVPGELFGYLNTRGLELRIEGADPGAGADTAAYFVPPGVKFDAAAPDRDHLIYVRLFPTSRAARKAAAAEGGTVFAWGRFVIDARDEDRRSQVRQALGLPPR